jgi:hypothetical protein
MKDDCCRKGLIEQLGRTNGSVRGTGQNSENTHCGAVFILKLWIFSLISISAFAAGGGCPANLPVTGNSCYFIAANGSDANNGTSESTPWLHAPGMPNCSGNCASVAPSSGKGFIFRGGDTWHFGDSRATPYTGGGWNINANWGTDSSCIYEGTTTGCIYYGVDKNWYAGSSWTRPIMTADNPPSTSLVSSCTYQVAGSFWGNNTLMLMGVATIIDNFELTGMCSQDVNTQPGALDIYIAYGGTGIGGSGMAFIENVYIHGWTATSAAGTGGFGYTGTLIGGGDNGLQTLDHIVIDGSDSNPGTWSWGEYPSFYHFRDSIVRNTTNGAGQWCHDIHDNIFENIVQPNHPNHNNILECNDDANGQAVNQPHNTPNVVYNNIIRHSNSNVDLWFCPENVPEYWFNNLFYDTEGEGWSYAGPPTYGCPNTGGQFMFNNTFVDGNLGSYPHPCYVPTVNHGGQYLTVYNEHLINTSFDSGTTPCTGLNSATNISMSDGVATSQGYTTGSPGSYLSNTCANDGTTPCAPTSSSNSTVGAGGNHQAYCTALASVTSEPAIGTDAASACKYGTTDACSYDTTSHTMICPRQTPVARPGSGAWDSGIYEYANSGGAPAPPSNLQALPQ